MDHQIEVNTFSFELHMQDRYEMKTCCSSLLLTNHSAVVRLYNIVLGVKEETILLKAIVMVLDSDLIIKTFNKLM